MIAVDTNIVVRLLTKDDAKQYNKALTLFKNNTVFISLTVLQETEWVLRFSYEFSPTAIHNAISMLAGLPNIEIEKPNIVLSTLELYSSGMDFSDALHLTQAGDCSRFLTFDKKLINKAKLNEICNVEQP